MSKDGPSFVFGGAGGGGWISKYILIGKRRKTQIHRKCINMLLISYNLIFNISKNFERDAERTQLGQTSNHKKISTFAFLPWHFEIQFVF